MSTRRINVCIADDHRLVRNGIARLLGMHDRIGEISEAENGEDLLQQIRLNPPDVVLLDLHMPIMGGVEACKRIVQEYPRIRVIILSMHDDPEMVKRMISLGAHGFLNKGADPEEVGRGICEALDRGFYNSDLIFNSMRVSSRSLPPTLNAPLSKREIEIVQLTCDGLTMREIAGRLNISEKTVQNHRANIMEKMGVHNAAGIINYANNSALVLASR